MPPPLTQMRAQFNSVLAQWGAAYAGTRLSATKNDAGKLSGSYASISGASAMTLWVQPVGGLSRIAPQGLNAETTHLGFQANGGPALVPKDRLTAAGGTYAYDVIRVLERETHNEIELKQIRRV